MKCILDDDLKNKMLTAPGWWFSCVEGRLIRVRRIGRKFIATLYLNRSVRDGSPNSQGRAVIGIYQTVREARIAAEMLAQMEPGCPRVTTWADVSKCRREMEQDAKAKGVEVPA